MLSLKQRGPFGLPIGFHYAWIIILIAAVMNMAGGSIRQAFGVLIVPLQEDMGWSPATITLGYAFASITGAVLAPFSGIATDNYGARKVIMVGVAAFVAGAFLTGVVSEVWHIWISYGLFLGVAQACFQVPILTTANYWFRTHLGWGMGLLQGANGLGPAVMAVLISILIVAGNWKTAFWGIGAIGGVSLVVLMIFFRNLPSDLGLRPFGARDTDPVFQEKVDQATAQARTRAFRLSMQSTSAFWKLVLVHFLGCVGHAIVIIYVVPIAVMAGVDLVTAAGVLSTLALASTVTRFASPVIADYMGSKGTMVAAFLWQGLPVLMLFWAHDTWHFYLFAVVFGLGYGGEGAAFPIINRQYFGRGPMGSSFGWQQLGAGIGMAVGAWIGGALFWVFDSYSITIVVSTVASVTGAIIIFSMEPTNRMLIPRWEDTMPAGAGAATPLPS